MNDPSTKPITILALMQVAVILFGILVAKLCFRLWVNYEFRPPGVTQFVLNQGISLVAIPLIWVGITTYVRNLSGAPQIVKTGLLLLGIALVVLLAAFMVVATVGPWWAVDRGLMIEPD